MDNDGFARNAANAEAVRHLRKELAALRMEAASLHAQAKSCDPRLAGDLWKRHAEVCSRMNRLTFRLLGHVQEAVDQSRAWTEATRRIAYRD